MELVQFENIKGRRVAATNSHVMAEFYKINIFSLETVIGKLISNNEITDSRYAVIYYNNLESKPSRVLYILDEIATYKVIRKYSEELKSWMTPYEEAFDQFNTLKCKPVESKKPIITKDVTKKENGMELVKFENIGGSSVAATTSLIIAEFTGKEHKHVLRDIETIVKYGELDQSNFGLISYKDSCGRDQKAIALDETFATILLMGFTGKESIRWKIAYSKAFQAMREELKAQPKVVERQKGDELSIADKMLKAVACAQREALEGKTEHTGYCVQISKRVNELALGHHETGMRQKLTPEQAAAVNKVALDVVKEAMKGNLNPSNVAKTLSAKYLEEAKDKVAKKELKSYLKEFKGKVKQDGKWVEATLMIGKKG